MMNLPNREVDLRISELKARYAQRTLLPSACIAEILKRIEEVDRPEVWISRVEKDALISRAAELDRMLLEQGDTALKQYPLFGIPFAVKDNIDVANMVTTAGCPEFAFTPTSSAYVVEKLLAAGAILIGKTNLDQFATGLVGTRSPYGAVRNALHPDRVSGGSSSGSAAAVALSLVSFSLGTDTAGSGRVPAGLHHIVGLKPSKGLLSASGVFPACRSLDCVSIFSKTIPDAWSIAQIAAGFDTRDAYSRQVAMLPVKTSGYRIAVPRQPEFFGDTQALAAYNQTLNKLKDMSHVELCEIDFSPFKDAASLLYQGPWVAERLAAVGTFYETSKEALHPVVAGIIGQGSQYSAVDTFNAQYRLADLKRRAEMALTGFNFMIVPTAPTFPTLADLEKEPVLRNSELGYYTNFVNFFDMAALAIPALERKDGLPFGITLIGPDGADHMLADAAQKLSSALGAVGMVATIDTSIATSPLPFTEPTIQVAVVGAHLNGQPLNWQLLECGARMVEATHTASYYKLHALAGTVPPKPGLERTAEHGAPIALEVWEMPVRHFGKFVAGVPAPLVIGTITLADGRSVKGFLCEPIALAEATDITQFGGWRAYLAANAADKSPVQTVTT
jgi:allophanate hydrolase